MHQFVELGRIFILNSFLCAKWDSPIFITLKDFPSNAVTRSNEVLPAIALEGKSFQVRIVNELLGAGRNFSDAIQVARNITSLPQ
jgi:hypothetical protein